MTEEKAKIIFELGMNILALVSLNISLPSCKHCRLEMETDNSWGIDKFPNIFHKIRKMV